MNINAVTRNLDANEQMVNQALVKPAQEQPKTAKSREVPEQEPTTIKNNSENIENVRDNLEDSIQNFEALSEQFNTGLDLSIDQDSDKLVVKVVNKTTGKIIREIPSEEFLEFSERMHDFLGVLFDGTA